MRFEQADIPIRLQGEAGLLADEGRALLAWEDPGAEVWRSPFWSGVPMLIGEPDPDPGPDPAPLLPLRAAGRQRRKHCIFMTAEHRAAASHDDIELERVTLEHGPALRRVAPTGTSSPAETPRDTILQVLEGADTPLSVRQIRECAGVRNATVSTAIEQLCSADRVIRNRHGYTINREQPGFPFE